MRRRWTALGGIAALASCAGCAGAIPEPVDTGEPSPPIDAAAGGLEWSAAELEASLERLLSDGFPEVDPVEALYLELLSHGDEGCPGGEDPLQLDGANIIPCEADSGYLFGGISRYGTLSAADEGYDGWALSAEFQIVDPEGREFLAGGAAFFGAAGGARTALLEGSWSAEMADGWLGRGASASLRYDASGGALWIDGTLGVEGDAASFEGLSYDASCGPSGAVWIRDPSGNWLELSLSCGECGPLSLDGEIIGEICSPLSSLAGDLAAAMEGG